MASERMHDIAGRARRIHDADLRDDLECNRRGEFVAIEPDSGDHFIGKTLSEAIQASRAAHPDRLAYALRIGEPTAIEIGTAES